MNFRASGKQYCPDGMWSIRRTRRRNQALQANPICKARYSVLRDVNGCDEFRKHQSTRFLSTAFTNVAVGVLDVSSQANNQMACCKPASHESNLYREAIRRFDQIIVASAMQRADGLQSKAAQILSLSRPTLRSKLREMDSQGPMS